MAKLVRSNKRMIAGVCAGVAEKLGWSVALVRMLWVVLAFAGLGSPVVFYAVLWIVMPAAAHEKKDYSERMKERLGK